MRYHELTIDKPVLDSTMARIFLILATAVFVSCLACKTAKKNSTPVKAVPQAKKIPDEPIQPLLDFTIQQTKNGIAATFNHGRPNHDGPSLRSELYNAMDLHTTNSEFSDDGAIIQTASIKEGAWVYEDESGQSVACDPQKCKIVVKSRQIGSLDGLAGYLAAIMFDYLEDCEQPQGFELRSCKHEKNAALIGLEGEIHCQRTNQQAACRINFAKPPGLTLSSNALDCPSNPGRMWVISRLQSLKSREYLRLTDDNGKFIGALFFSRANEQVSLDDLYLCTARGYRYFGLTEKARKAKSWLNGFDANLISTAIMQKGASLINSLKKVGVVDDRTRVRVDYTIKPINIDEPKETGYFNVDLNENWALDE